MSKSKEFLLLRKMGRKLVDQWYPGYPVAFYGVIDCGTKDIWIDPDTTTTLKDWVDFKKYFDINLLYHILDTNLATKGSWVRDTEMANYKKFVESAEEPFDDYFWIQSEGLVRLYFGVWAAIREYQDQKKYIFFSYDEEYSDTNCQIKVFSSLEEIEQYRHEYGFDTLE